MRVLVIYCHPVDSSYSAALHRAALNSLSRGGHKVIDLDLYAAGFDPLLSRQERIDYHNVNINSAGIRKYADQLVAAEGVVLIYPSWWYGFPAMLKGYFDRVWLPGTAFDVLPNGKIGADRLPKLRRIVVITTYGSPRWWIRLFMGDPARKIISRGFRRICARGCRISWYVKYGMDKADTKDLQRFLDQVCIGIQKELK